MNKQVQAIAAAVLVVALSLSVTDSVAVDSDDGMDSVVITSV